MNGAQNSFKSFNYLAVVEETRIVVVASIDTTFAVVVVEANSPSFLQHSSESTAVVAAVAERRGPRPSVPAASVAATVRKPGRFGDVPGSGFASASACSVESSHQCHSSNHSVDLVEPSAFQSGSVWLLLASGW